MTLTQEGKEHVNDTPESVERFAASIQDQIRRAKREGARTALMEAHTLIYDESMEHHGEVFEGMARAANIVYHQLKASEANGA